jgi:hypothetical protein
MNKNIVRIFSSGTSFENMIVTGTLDINCTIRYLYLNKLDLLGNQLVY